MGEAYHGGLVLHGPPGIRQCSAIGAAAAVAYLLHQAAQLCFHRFANTIVLPRSAARPSRPVQLPTYANVQLRNAAVHLQSLRQGPSSVLADATGLHQRRQCPSSATAATTYGNP